MSAREDTIETVLAELQAHTLTRRPPIPSSAKELFKELRGALVTASHARALSDAPHDVFKRLKHTESKSGHAQITGGALNFKRDPTFDHFTRRDGAWFDFHITVLERERGEPIELVAYGFELRFADADASRDPSWIRFDFNFTEHDNEERGLRSHFHPSTDDWSVPAPLLSPTELLHLFLHRFKARHPERKRGTSKGVTTLRGDELPRVLTALPEARAQALVDALAHAECPGLTARGPRREELLGARHDSIVWAAARGANVLDVDGNLYVDMTARFGAALIGHTHPRVVDAVRRQSERLLLALGDMYTSEVTIELEARLAAMAPWPARVILGLSGADSIEVALKTALLRTKRRGVIAFEGGYHGLSYGPAASSGYPLAFRGPFGAELPAYVRFAPFADARDEDSLHRSLEVVDRQLAIGDVGAVLVEPIQARGGVIRPPDGFLTALAEKTRNAGALFVADEVYTGLHRTGGRFRMIDAGAEPDMICIGNALGGGLPVSACLVREELTLASADAAQEAVRTSTFLGNPLGHAAALATLDALEDPATQRTIWDASECLSMAVEALARDASLAITRVTTAGLLAGVAVEGGVSRSLSVMRAMLGHGYVILAGGVAGDVLTLAPPCVLTRTQTEGFTEALADALRAVRP